MQSGQCCWIAATLAVAAALGQSVFAGAATAAPAWSLDEGKLTPAIRFQAGDLDPKGSACRDFAAYANDRWHAANPIPGDQVAWGAGGIARQRSLEIRRQIAEHVASLPAPTAEQKLVADFWHTGMDEARINAQGIAPLKDRLAQIDSLADGAAVADYVREAAARGEGTVFAFGPEADFSNSKMVIGYAMQGGLGLPDKTYYVDADKAAIREAYERHVARVLELSGRSVAGAAAEAKTVMALETRLARVSKSAEEMSRDVALYYSPVSPAQADALTPNFRWTRFFAALGMPSPEVFSLSNPDFHQEVSRMFADVPVAQWKTYLRYHLLDDASPYLSDAFVNEHFEFHSKTLLGQKELAPRWKRVLDGGIEEGVGEAMGRLYVDAAFPASSKARMQELVGNLSAALKVRIENLAWMSDATRRKALEKWATFTPKVGYPDKWRDWSGLVTQRDSYVANVLAAREFNYRREVAKIGKPVDRTEWGMTPQTVNAYYHPLLNEIVFPAAILQPPFFDPQADDPLNYGAIGAVIGHEMTHGYDDQGSRFGPSGNFEQWWTEEDAARFKALTERLVKQYDSYEALPGLRVNGNLTLGENIADLGGLSIAYDALQRASAGKPDPRIDGLTRDQRFFLGYAAAWRSQRTPEATRVLVASDPHSPARVRANGPPRNVPGFATAFGCQAGDPMVHTGDQLVVIW